MSIRCEYRLERHHHRPEQRTFSNRYLSLNATNPDRDKPFREFTVVYHDEVRDIQAFPQFEDPVLSHTLHGVQDKFAINYGIAGVGAEILANRLGVGPMFNCTECKYEEFFLSSWAIGDPAQIVDVPANTKNSSGVLIKDVRRQRSCIPTIRQTCITAISVIP